MGLRGRRASRGAVKFPGTLSISAPNSRLSVALEDIFIHPPLPKLVPIPLDPPSPRPPGDGGESPEPVEVLHVTVTNDLSGEEITFRAEMFDIPGGG